MADDTAAAQSLSFLVAGVVFIASIGTVLFVSSSLPHDEDAAGQAALHNSAASILAMLADSPGVGMENGPENYERFSLMDPAGQALNHDVALHLCRAATVGDHDDGRIDYSSVSRSLGLDPDDGAQFHLSLTPAEIPDTDFSTMRVAYIGQLQPGTGLTGPGISTTAIAYGTSYTYPGGNYVQQLDSHFSATALSERETIQAMGVDHKPMPDAYGSTVEGTVELIPGVPLAASLYFDEEILHGDEYFGHVQHIQETLANRLGVYDLLIVGTHVDHSALTPLAPVLGPWVAAGGKILVLGTDDSDGTSSSPDWLQPLIASGTSSQDGQSLATGSIHPIFTSFYRLDPDAFRGSAPFQVQTPMIMENVLPAELPDTSYLTVSRCGSLGDGLLARLSYTDADDLQYHEYQPKCVVDVPRKLLGQFTPCVDENNPDLGIANSAKELLQNLAAYGNNQALYLDFGPDVPPGSAVAHQMRLIAYEHPDHGAMSMEAHVFVWRN